jgi:hypothetical protein
LQNKLEWPPGKVTSPSLSMVDKLCARVSFRLARHPTGTDKISKR